MANHKMQNSFNLQSKWYTGIAIWKYLLSLVCSLVCFTYNWGLWVHSFGWTKPKYSKYYKNVNTTLVMCNVYVFWPKNWQFSHYQIKNLFIANTIMYSNSNFVYLFRPSKYLWTNNPQKYERLAKLKKKKYYSPNSPKSVKEIWWSLFLSSIKSWQSQIESHCHILLIGWMQYQLQVWDCN